VGVAQRHGGEEHPDAQRQRAAAGPSTVAKRPDAAVS